MSSDTILALIVFLFPLAYSPGPGNAFFAAIGAARGLRAAIPALLGYHAATFVVTAVIGLGVGVAVLSDPTVATVLAATGALYVLWLAIQFLRAAHRRRRAPGDVVASPPVSVGFWAGVIVLVLNPKAYAIIAAMFTQFLQPAADDQLATVLAITAIFTLNNAIAFVIWAVGGAGLALLFRTPRSQRWLDYLFAAMLAAVALWMSLPLIASLR